VKQQPKKTTYAEKSATGSRAVGDSNSRAGRAETILRGQKVTGNNLKI
jgi:hypothetical protein